MEYLGESPVLQLRDNLIWRMQFMQESQKCPLHVLHSGCWAASRACKHSKNVWEASTWWRELWRQRWREGKQRESSSQAWKRRKGKVRETSTLSKEGAAKSITENSESQGKCNVMKASQSNFTLHQCGTQIPLMTSCSRHNAPHPSPPSRLNETSVWGHRSMPGLPELSNREGSNQEPTTALDPVFKGPNKHHDSFGDSDTVHR